MKLMWRDHCDNRVPHWWWGFCWCEDFNRVRVFAPIGLNLIIVAGYWLWKQVAYQVSWRLFPDGVRTKAQDEKVIAALKAKRDSLFQKDVVTVTETPCGGLRMTFTSPQWSLYDALDYAITALERP